ncbi:hypothetical protein BDA99DRAFT_44661 [Phascolomyces articulosus]|uniref:Uncharacterized protein n=1 Tax=Phascolomyces articulosus TaxID=60185 RepID=A0AAD5K229_9FUNG|nr:hypothetical protein BDA99DRAFT_44661 [Phascolomyces articulosus]
MTHCLDIEEGHGLGEEVPFFVKIRQEGYEAHQARLERLASVQSTKVVGSIAPAVALLPRRHRRFRMMASVLRPMTPLNRELPQTSRAVLGDSDAVSGRVPKVAPPTVRDTEMEDLVKQFESMHLCSDPVSPQAIFMSLDSSDETPFMVEPFVEDTSAAADLGDSNVVPIYMPVEVEAIADGDVDMLGGDSSTSFVVVDEYAPGNVQQEENPFNLQHVVEPLVDPAVVLNVPASGLATASMRMTSGLATASMSVTSELASAFKSPVVDNVTSASPSASGSTMRMTSGSAMSDKTSELATAFKSSGFGLTSASTDLASGSATRKTSGSAMSGMTSGLASASKSSGFGLATASTDLASSSAMRKTSGSAMSEGFGYSASGSASASSMRKTSGSAMSDMTSGLATASMSSSPADVSVVDRSASTTQNDNQDFDFTFSFSAPATASHSVPASPTPMSSASSSDGDYVPRSPTPSAPSSSASSESGDYIPRSPSPSVTVVSEADEQELRYSSEGELPPDHLDILDLM